MKIILATSKEIEKNKLGSGKNKTNFSDEHISNKAFFIVFISEITKFIYLNFFMLHNIIYY